MLACLLAVFFVYACVDARQKSTNFCFKIPRLRSDAFRLTALDVLLIDKFNFRLFCRLGPPGNLYFTLSSLSSRQCADNMVSTLLHTKFYDQRIADYVLCLRTGWNER